MLAHQQLDLTDKGVDRGVVSLVEKGETINRGLEEVLYEEDYWYGPDLLAIAAPLNSDATVPVTFRGPIAGHQGYLAVFMEMRDGRHFGWIEIKCSNRPIWLTRPAPGMNGIALVDTEFHVTDAYLNPTAEEAVIAGEKD